MTRRSRKLFSWTVITGLIFNLISPLFLLPWQQVWACFGSWDCGGNAYCAGAGSYPDHPGSCASYGERGNNDRTTSEIAQDYINNGGNPAEVVTRTADFQGALSNNNAAAAAAAAQQLAAAEAQRIAAEQAAAANAAAAAAAAKAADDKAKAEAQRLAQEAAERSARAAANAAAAAAAMTAINAAAPAGTPAAGAGAPAIAASTPTAAATGASCGSSAHNACSPNSDGNWYKCVNGSWQKYDDCKPAGAITCAAPACAGANGCIDEGVSAMYNGVEKVCGGGKEGEKGRWIDKSTVPAVKPQDPNPEEAMEIWLATEDGGLANRGSPLPTAVNSPTAKPIVTAPTTAVAPPTSAPIPTAPTQQTAQEQNQEQNLERFRCGEKGGTWTNNTCQSPGRPSPTIAPNPTAAIRRPVNPTLIPSPQTPVPTAKFTVPAAADREDRIQQPPETCRPGIVRNPDGTCANPTSNVKIETETVRVGGGVFGREVKVTTKTFCSGNSAVTQTSRSDGTESSDSKVCEWGCDGGTCRPPTIQETAVVRMEVINNAIDLAKVRCGQQGKKDCSTVSVYQDAMANMDPEEPSPYQVAIRNSGTTAVQRETLIQAEYNKLLREQVELASMGEAGAGMTAGPIDQAGLRQQAERKVDETIAAYKLSEGGGNTPAAVGRSLDKIGELSAEEAQGQIDQQGWLYGTIIAKPMFCGMNNNYRASGACGVEHASALNEEGLESARAYWTFLITGRTEQALQDLGMIIGDPRSPGFQGRDYNANVALPCGVRSSEGEEEVTDEELACLKGKNVEAQFRLAEVDRQNQTNAVLNVVAAGAGFAGGAIVGGAKAASLVGKAGLFLVREGMVSDVALSPLFAETTTAGQRAGADALAALATAPDLTQTERETLSELAAQADEEADRAYTENLLMNAASTVVIGAAGSGAGRAAREVFGETWLGRLLLGNLDVPAGRAAAAEVADEANRVIIGGDGTVWNVKPEVVNPRTALQEGELLIISPGERNARTATAAELVNLPEESLVWHRGPDGDEVLHIADSRGDLHVVEPGQRTGQTGGAAGPRAVSAVDIEGVADRVVTTEDVVSAARDTRAALRGETDVLGEQAVVAGADTVPAGAEVSEAVVTVRTASRQNSGFIAEVKQGVGQIVSEGEIAITDVGRTLEKGVDNVVINAAETVRSATQAAGEAFDNVSGALPFGRKSGLDLEGPPASAAKNTGEAFPETGTVEVVPKGGGEPYRVDYDQNNLQTLDSLRPGDTVNDGQGQGLIKNENGTWSPLNEEPDALVSSRIEPETVEPKAKEGQLLDVNVNSESPTVIPGTNGTEINKRGNALLLARDRADSVTVNGKLITAPTSVHPELGDKIVINGVSVEITATPDGFRLRTTEKVAPLVQPLGAFQPISKPQFDAENALAVSRDSFDQLGKTEQAELMNKVEIKVLKPDAEMMQQGKESIRGIFGKDDWRITTAGDLKKAGLEPKYKIEIYGVASSGQPSNTTFYFSDVFGAPDGRLYAIGYSGEPPSPKVFYKSNSHGNWRVAPDAILHLGDKGYRIGFGKGNIPELGVQEEFATTIATELQVALSDLTKNSKKVKNADSLAFGLLSLNEADAPWSSLADNIKIEDLFVKDPKTGKRIFRDPGYEPDYSRVVYEYDSTACPPGLTCSGKAVVFASKDGQIHYTYFYDPASDRVWPLSVGSSNSPVNELGTRSLYFDSGDYFIGSPYEYKDTVAADYALSKAAKPVPGNSVYMDVYDDVAKKPHVKEAKSAIENLLPQAGTAVPKPGGVGIATRIRSGITDTFGAVNSALAEDGIVGRAIAGVEEPITNLGRRLETAVDGVFQTAVDAIEAAKINLTGKGRVPVDVAIPESGTFVITSIRDSAAAIQPLPIENVPRRIIDPNTLTDQIDPKLSSSADVYKLKLEIDGTETPVVVKVYRFSDARTPMAFPNEINRAQIADQLGIGPRFHGIADLGDGRLAYIVDEVPGVTSKGAIAGQDFGEYVTRQTLEDIRIIEARLVDNGFAVSGDFEFMITPNGRAVVIDPSAILPEPSSSRLTQTGGIMDGRIRILMEARAESQGVPGLVANAIDSWSGVNKKTKPSPSVDGGGGDGAVPAVPATQPKDFTKYLTGVDYTDPTLPQKLLDDHFMIKQKYGLPKRDIRFENPLDYIRELEVIAKENGIPIRDKSEFQQFFEENPIAGAMYDNKGRQIFVDLSKDPVQLAGDVEHELTHALQHRKYPEMPIETREYEAYVGANMRIGDDFLQDPENIANLFGQIGTSAKNWYKEEKLPIPWEQSLPAASVPVPAAPGFREGEVFGPKGPLDFDWKGFRNKDTGGLQFPIGRPKPPDVEVPVKPGREGVGGGDGGIIPAEGAGQGGLGGIGGKVSNVVRESGERIGQAVSATREKILPSKITISEPEWNEKTIGIDGLQTEIDNLVSQAKGQGVPPGTKITISYFDDNLKLKTIHTKLETLATAIRNVSENNQFGTLFGELSIKFGNSGVELGSVSNLSDPQNIVWDVRNIPTKAELNYLITHSADFREKVALARDIGILGFIPVIGAAIGVTGAEAGYYYYYKPTTDKVLLKDPEAASRDPRNLPPDDFRCVGNQIVEVSAATGEVLKTLETCQSGCSSGMCQAKENTACQPGERLKVSDSSESCSLSCVDGAYARDFAQCDAIDLSGISTNRYREVVMRTLSILPDDFFPVEKFDKLSIFEVPLAHFSQGDIGDFSPEVNWRDQETELYGMASISGEHLLIGREVLSEGLVSGVSGMLIHELLHLWASQSIKPLPEGVPYSYVAAIVTETLGGSEGTPLDYPSVTGCLVGGAGSAFHDRPVDGRAINCGEDFAYAGTQYVLEACYLKNYSPERYEYFKSEVFRGKEYIPESGCPSQGG